MDRVIPSTNLPRIIIVGGGFGGINLAKSLKNKPFQVVMLDKNNYHTFQPLLYQVATGGLEPDSIAFPIRKVFDEQENFIFRNIEVKHVYPDEKFIETSIGAISYDYLVIATGTKTNFFGLDIADKAMSMKTIPEALDLRSLILQNFERCNYEQDANIKSALMKFVVVGGGPTGVETSGALAELKKFVLPADYPELDMRQMEIHLIEAGPRLLGAMSEKSSQQSQEALEKMGVHVLLNTVVKNYDGKTVTTADGREFESVTVIWSAGVKGCIIEGIDAEVVNKNGRFLVDAYNRIQSYSDVFAIGDVAYMETDKHFPKGHPQVAQVAIQMGANLGNNLVALENKAPLRPFAYYDKGNMATIGRNKAVVDLAKAHFSGLLAWLMWMMVHLLFLIGFRNRLVVLANWVWSYLTYDKGARVIIRPYKKPTVPDTVLK